MLGAVSAAIGRRLRHVVRRAGNALGAAAAFATAASAAATSAALAFARRVRSGVAAAGSGIHSAAAAVGGALASPLRGLLRSATGWWDAVRLGQLIGRFGDRAKVLVGSTSASARRVTEAVRQRVTKVRSA